MKMSEAGLNYIKSYEELRLRSYICPAGKLTVGYGHTGPDVKPNMIITEAEAAELFRKDCAWVEAAVNAMNADLQQNEFDALCSLVFNIGADKFRNSTIRRLIVKKADKQKIADQFLVWTYIKGHYSQGLQNRRREEQKIFLKGYQL